MNPYNKTKQNQGFTLIELMLAIGLLSILMLLAMPNLSQFVQKQKLATQGEIISSTFGVARSEALNQLSNIEVCWNPKSSDEVIDRRDVEINPGMMAVLTLAASAVEIRQVEYDVDNTLTVDDETDNCATYSPQGRLIMSSIDGNELVFGVCRASGEKKDSRSIQIGITGRPVIKKNVDDDGSQTIDCT